MSIRKKNFLWYNDNSIISLILGFLNQKERIIVSTCVIKLWTNILINCGQIIIPKNITKSNLRQILKCTKNTNACYFNTCALQYLTHIILTLPNLQILKLSNDQINNITNEELRHIFTLQNLQQLDLQNV